MKKLGVQLVGAFVVALLLQTPGITGAEPPSQVEWEAAQSWKTPHPPIDIARSLSSQLIFVLTNRGQVHVYGSRGEERGVIPVGKGVSRIELTPDDSQLIALNPSTGKVRIWDIFFRQKINTKGSPFLGPAGASVEIIVFSDYFCPSCAGFIPTIAEINLMYPKKVRFVFKQYPIGKGPLLAAQAALAAIRQDLFWPLHQKLFAHAEGLDKKKIYQLAREAGLDMARFKVDMNGAEVRRQLRQDERDGNRAGLTGVPAVFVNGRQVWDRSSKELKKAIAQELKANK